MKMANELIHAAICQCEWALDVADTEHKAEWFDAVIGDVRKIHAILSQAEKHLSETHTLDYQYKERGC